MNKRQIICLAILCSLNFNVAEVEPKFGVKVSVSPDYVTFSPAEDAHIRCIAQGQTEAPSVTIWHLPPGGDSVKVTDGYKELFVHYPPLRPSLSTYTIADLEVSPQAYDLLDTGSNRFECRAESQDASNWKGFTVNKV